VGEKKRGFLGWRRRKCYRLQRGQLMYSKKVHVSGPLEIPPRLDGTGRKRKRNGTDGLG